jgi:hypothetical protein
VRHAHKTITILFMALLALGLTACSDSDTSTLPGDATAIDDYAAIDLNQEYGGLTATDEEPAFGDAYLLEMEVEDQDEAFDDPLLTDPEVLQMLALSEADPDSVDQARPRVTFLRLVWGALDTADSELPEDDEVLDWTGELSVDSGVVLVRRVIMFERPQDHLVLPRPDRQSLSWVSHTGGHMDGLVLQIIEPAQDDGTYAPNQLHLQTVSFSGDFDLAEISGMDEFIEVAPPGNGLHLAAFTLGEPDPCPRGFLSGRWCDDPDADGQGGMFRGRWVDIFGITRGYMLGRWGLNEDGEQVFAGKYISRAGAFLGLMRGAWFNGEEVGAGGFQGHWAGRQGEFQGHLQGRWLQRPDLPCGIYQGRWATQCEN